MQNTVISFIIEYFYYVFLGWIILHILHRKYGSLTSQKRTANLYQAILIFTLYIYALSLREFFTENDLYLIPFIALQAGIIYFFRSRILPYKISCENCGKKMTLKEIFFQPDHYCVDCVIRAKEQEQEISVETTEEDTSEQIPEEKNSEN